MTNPVNHCVLCNSTDIHTIDNISVDRLNKVYLKEYDIDITDDIKTDMTLEHCKDCDLRFFNPLFTGSQSFYEQLQKFDWYYKSEKFEYTHVNHFQEVRAAESLLEIGCGKGVFSDYLTANYTGLEFSETAVAEAAALGRRVYNKSIEEYSNNTSSSYDVVCSFQVLEHTENPRSFIQGCIDCLKPNGTLIITTPAEDSWIGYKQDFSLNMPPHHVTRWTDKCYTDLGKLFPVELLSLEHTPLEPFHIPWYINSWLVHAMNERLGIKHSVVSSKRHRVQHIISDTITWMLKANLPVVYRGLGDTVIAKYRKL